MTTTHAARGAGRPRLVLARTTEDRQFPLESDCVLIGSAPDNDIVLPGIEPQHARIDHDEHDEYVLTLLGPGEMNALSRSDDSRSEVLRTGAQFTMGEWTLVFMREEFADHGRPYGGRQGGELSDQPLQPPRPDHRAQWTSESADEPGRRQSTSDDGGGTGAQSGDVDSEQNRVD